MIHKSVKTGGSAAGIHRDRRRQLPGGFNIPGPETDDQASSKIVQPSPEAHSALCQYRTLVEIAGTILGLGDEEDAIVYLGDVHGISRYSEVRGSACGLRPGERVYACLVGQLGLDGSRLAPVQTSPALDLSQGLPRDLSHPWGVILMSPGMVGLHSWCLIRTEEFESMFAKMRIKPEYLLPLRDPDLVGQDFFGLAGNAGVELASQAATAEEVIRSSPLRYCRPGETPGPG